MQFTTAIAIFAATALALPAAPAAPTNVDIPEPSTNVEALAAPTNVDIPKTPTDVEARALQARKKCDLYACATSMGGPALTCIAAAAQAEANPFVDAACVLGVLHTYANPPEPCTGCN